MTEQLETDYPVKRVFKVVLTDSEGEKLLLKIPLRSKSTINSEGDFQDISEEEGDFFKTSEQARQMINFFSDRDGEDLAVNVLGAEIVSEESGETIC